MCRKISGGNTARSGGLKPAGSSRRRHPGWPLQLSPLRLLLTVAVLVFTAEAAIMLLLSTVPPLSPPVEALLDAAILLLFLSPLYFLVYLPLRAHYAAHLNADREIRSLSRETLRALERERTRFVQDIHDDCGQIVTAVGLGVDILRYTVPPDRDDLTGQCTQIRELVGELGDKLRALSARLRPALLETCGIVPALEWHIRQTQDGGVQTQITLESEGVGRLDPEVETAIFRLCQEGIANILRHSQAANAAVRLACSSEGVRLRIDDDGVGFDPHACGHGSGLGLVAMRERAAAFDGTFEIDAEPGRGTSLTAFFPTPEPTP